MAKNKWIKPLSIFGGLSLIGFALFNSRKNKSTNVKNAYDTPYMQSRAISNSFKNDNSYEFRETIEDNGKTYKEHSINYKSADKVHNAIKKNGYKKENTRVYYKNNDGSTRGHIDLNKQQSFFKTKTSSSNKSRTNDYMSALRSTKTNTTNNSQSSSQSKIKTSVDTSEDEKKKTSNISGVMTAIKNTNPLVSSTVSAFNKVKSFFKR